MADPVLCVTTMSDKNYGAWLAYDLNDGSGRRLRFFTELIGKEITFKSGPCSLPDSDARKRKAHTWIITELLKESTTAYFGQGIPEVKGVFRCVPKAGACPINLDAIYKVYVQLPPPADYERGVVREPERGRSKADREGWALCKMMAEGCASTPQVYYESEDRQGPRDLLPGGQINGIFMELVPGVALCKPSFDFRAQSSDTKERIRAAFAVAIYEVRCHDINPMDQALRNIIWDEKRGKCYLIDFESFMQLEGEEPSPYSDYLGAEWGLL